MMDMRSSKKIEGNGLIQRPNKQQHINTFSLPFQRTVEAVPYYARRKRQLKGKNFIFQAKIQSDNPSQFKDLQKEVQDQFKGELQLANYITDISIEPVFTDNKFTDFNPQNYPLNQHQKVKVVEEKYFPLQNYYNYIWALKSKEEVFRLAEQTREKANSVLQKRMARGGGNYVEHLDLDNGPKIRETKIIKGLHESKVTSHGKNKSNKKYSVDQLSPVYQQYQEGKPRNNPFEVKEKDRQKILSDFATRYFVS